MRTLLLGVLLFTTASAQEAPQAEPKERAKLARKQPRSDEMDTLGRMLDKEKAKLKGNPPPEAAAAAQQRMGVLDEQVKRLLAQKPDDLSVQAGGADYWLQRGNFTAAADQADKALSLGNPDGDPALTSDLLNTKAISMYERGDVPGAWQTALQALEYNPYNTKAIETVKYTEGRGPRTQPGLDGTADGGNIERLVAASNPVQPHTTNDYINRHQEHPTAASDAAIKALKQRTMGNLAAARMMADRALEEDHGDPMAHAVKGFVLNDMKDYNGAIIETSQAMAKGWSDPVLFSVRAQALEQVGQLKAALHDADLAARLAPETASNFYLRASIQRKLDVQEGRVDGRFLADLKRAAELDPAKFGAFYEKNLREFEERKANGEERKAGHDQQPQVTGRKNAGQAAASADWRRNERTVGGKVRNRVNLAAQTVKSHPQGALFVAGGVGIFLAGGVAFALSGSSKPTAAPPKGQIEVLYESPDYKAAQEVYRVERMRRNNETAT